MSESLRKFKEIAVINKILAELDRAIGIKDKVLAEFVLNLAKQAQSATEFETILAENEADFAIDLTNTLYATVTRMLPEYFKQIAQDDGDLDDKNNVENRFIHRMLDVDQDGRPKNIDSQALGTEESKFE